ncbi:MAG: cytochrome b/b6 domain-containing protein [Rhodospirillales bacterium]|nr:cytochrome b/b6 domain-containing protein [Rhodospirillales bacterium]MCB9996162.1 cytochrome b/b6 domain-containing protein [Rhodospirillales bacterium]
MGVKNTTESYGIAAKGLHWVMALMVLGLLLLGFYMGGLDFSPFKLSLYGWHKSFGTLVLFLVAFRLAWRLANPRPAHIKTHKGWEKALAALVHILLYAGMIVMPLSGWLMSSAGDFAHSFFGLFEMPDLVGKDKDLFRQMREVHEVGAFMILAAIFLHAAGAFKHHFIDKDGTLRRMLPAMCPRLGAGLALLLFVTLAGGAVLFAVLEEEHESKEAAPVQVSVGSPASPEIGAHDITAWQIVKEQSRISFQVTVQGETFSGTFEDFDGVIRFDPDKLDQSFADISVQIASVKTGSEERDSYIRMPVWLDAQAFPAARFVSTRFTADRQGGYVVDGALTLRGVSADMSIPFTLDINDDRADMQARFTISRPDYGIGGEEWGGGDTVGHQVDITVDLVTEPLP